MTFPSPQMSDLAVRFFAMFSRMEFALKRIDGFRTQQHGFIEANWREFSKTKKVQAVYARLVKSDIAAELIEKPPKHRIIGATGSLTWSEQPPRCEDMEAVIAALRGVRNNLFHGEKGHIETDRDHKLFKAGIEVLSALLEACPEAARNYWF